MPARIVPMIHVPDVKATADWYVGIGFRLDGWNNYAERRRQGKRRRKARG